MEEHTGDHLMTSLTVRVWPALRASEHTRIQMLCLKVLGVLLTLLGQNPTSQLDS